MRRALGALGAHSCLVRPLGRLVGTTLVAGGDIGERGEIGDDLLPAGRPHSEVAGEHAGDDPRLERAEARQCREPPMELRSRTGLAPQAGGVAAVGLRDDAADALSALGHAAGKAVNRGRGAKSGGKHLGVGGGQALGVEGPEPLAHPQRSEERLLDRELLIEAEADEQGEWVLGDQTVGRRVLRPFEGGRTVRCGHVH